MKDLYICFSNIDRETILPVVELLEKTGFSCWLPGRDSIYFGNWQQAVTDAIHESVMILYFDSEAARKSFRLVKELQEAKESGLLQLTFELETVTPEGVLAEVKAGLEEAKKIQKDVSVIIPYAGDKPYIFASYSHKDKQKVFSIIRILQSHGYRVWFDEGIDPGTEWDDNIATHLEAAGYLIPFFSKNYFESTNCKDELYFARELGLDILPVYLEDMELDPAYAMRFGRKQALFFYKYTDKRQFLDKVDTAQDIDLCRDEQL